MEQRMETVEQLVSFQHIQVQLQGGAPWGFTLKGGLEHGEPLIITKIEDGGKAAQCKKLRVGDELVNINGSALYGSRQEALILIKGSYRILKMVVRRRSVPVIRPHSWHLAKLSEPSSTAAPDAPPAMQLHPVPFSVPWHSGGDNSDLSMQWNQLSRHCSTDRSSSLGSMESLDPPSQGYYESQLSPVDPAIFNNKRDSAYSSFSASSNTSDYTVSLRPDEACSMDNLLHGLGRCTLSAEEAGVKSHSLSRLPEAQVRPSSYAYEGERGGGGGPPQPPARRDSFRATRGRPDKRCTSAPVDILSLSSCRAEDPLKTPGQSERGCPCEARGDVVSRGNRTDQYYMLSSQLEPCRDCNRARDHKEEVPVANLTVPERTSPASSPSPPQNSPGRRSNVEHTSHTLPPPENKHAVGGHRHSAPEKLLSAQLRLMEMSNGRAESTPSACGQWPKSPPRSTEKPESPDASEASPGRWGGSRCSTPGSVAALEAEEPQVQTDNPGPIPTLSHVPRSWGRSVSVPGDPPTVHPPSGTAPDPTALPGVFGGLSGAASMDTLLEEARGGGEEAPKPLPKPGSTRQHRSSKSRRRSERFATNLRNEIQRKKAQLQRSTGGSSLLHNDDTLEEEEGGEAVPEAQIRLASPSQSSQTLSYRAPSPNAPGPLNRLVSNSTPQLHPSTPAVHSRRDQDNARGPEGCDPSRGQADEEPGPTGKARRWRWTPEHKLQLEVELEKRSLRVGAGSSATLAQPGRPSATVSRFSRLDECDILPFADRRKFFEETSRSMSVSNLPGLMSRRQRPERHGKHPGPAHTQTATLEPGRRRYSYQGCARQDVTARSPVEPRRPSVSSAVQGRGDPEPQKRPSTDSHSGAPNRSQYPYERHVDHVPLSAFHPVAPVTVPAPQESQHSRLGREQRSRTPTDAYPVREREQTKLNRKFSLTERDYTWCRRDLQTVEGAAQQGCRMGNLMLSTCSVEEPPATQYPQRGRALSESDIRLDSQRLCTRVAAFTAPALSELEETASTPRKKAPPRPPPPNWEQFHRRRASHHNLLSLSYQNLLSSATPSPPKDVPAPQHPEGSSHHLYVAELTRPRSHSLPPRQEPPRLEPESLPERSPAFLHRGFRPVAPPLQEYDLPHQHHAPPTAPPSEPYRILTDPDAAPAQGRPAVLKPAPLTKRGAAEWETQNPANGAQHSSAAPSADSSSHMGALLPRSYFSVSYKQQQELYRKDPEQRTAFEVTNGPFETDIDEFRDGAVEEPMGTETQCFARPVTVLETDIDTLPEVEAAPAAMTRTPRGSLVDPLLVENSGSRARADLMEELFPHSAEGEAGGETWRGGHNVLELTVDTLERRSRQGSSRTQGQGSYCNSTATKAQLLNKIKELPGMNSRDDDEELCYKRQLMESLRKKLGVLREAQRGLQEDIRANAQLGEEVETLVLAVCKPNEVDKFRMFIGDLDKVVSLLLSLSGRLLRVESALECLGDESAHHERLPLLEKKKLLQGQLGEAQELKEHVDRREQAVCRVLGRCLTPEQLRDYSHYVKMKAALLVEQRQLEDKIRLGEEQLRALHESLGLGMGVPAGLGYGHY
ncbi:protein Shroom4 isoform X1 [Conger conger]|uniref:protein Shroom4 isoform X1 n=2 Tax=Conger conger TaxID=82655 RepID=UPI002A5A8A94|nr:protein Shroom4 isoform X1 [Conger conger]